MDSRQIFMFQSHTRWVNPGNLSPLFVGIPPLRFLLLLFFGIGIPCAIISILNLILFRNQFISTCPCVLSHHVHEHACTRARTNTHTHAHAHAHTRTHARTQARTHTRTRTWRKLRRQGGHSRALVLFRIKSTLDCIEKFCSEGNSPTEASIIQTSHVSILEKKWF